MMITDLFHGDITSGAFSTGYTSCAHVCTVPGLSLIATPPGRFDVHMTDLAMAINIVPDGGPSPRESRLNGSSLVRVFERDYVGAFAAGQDYRLRCENTTWELMIELDEARLAHIAAEHLDGRRLEVPGYAASRDVASATLARLAIIHLRSAECEPLYLESLALTIVSRRVSACSGSAADVSTGGTEWRIHRSIDCIDAHLEQPLGIAELAQIACMSPSWFTRCFRRVTGRSVHEFVLERRLERARTLVETGEMPLSRVAESCGFSHQSHLTRRYRNRFGITPGAVRRRR